MSSVQAVELLVILLTHALLLASQYWVEPQACAVAAPQLPMPSQLADITELKSLLHCSGHAVSEPGKTQDAWVPSQYFLPQMPLPAQLVRGVVTVVHWPRGLWSHA